MKISMYMHVLHALWAAPGRLYLWAESSSMPLEAPKGRGRKPKKPKTKAHPFANAGDELRADIEAISGLFRGEPR